MVLDSAGHVPVSVNIVDSSLNDNDNNSVVTFTFLGPVTGFTSADVTATHGTLTDFVVIDASHYTAKFTAADGFDGLGSVSVTAGGYTDTAGNAGAAGGDTVSIDTSADLGPALALTIDAANLVTNNAEKTAVGFTVAGLDADATGVVTFTDASSNTVTVNVSANGSYSANLSALTDGPISSVLNVTDDAANTASANGAAIDLDTSADLGPALALTIDAANLVTNNAEKTAVGFTVAGLDADATGVVTFTDASSNTVTVNVSANGSYSANLSALTDGPISSVLNVTDDAANTASANGAAIDLDTSADLGPALALTIDAANLVTNNAEKTAVGFTVAGLDADATGVVTFTDASSNTVTVNVSANGSYSANLSALTDGPISSVLNVTDDAANTASANGAAIDLDTSADLGPALALTIDAANLVTNNAEKTAVGFTVAGLDADATGVVTFTDASSNTVTVNVSANGSYSANLSALTDGPISSVLNVTDDAANTASANGAAIDLDTSADLGPALALTIDAANLVTNNAEKTAVGFTVAGLDADATGVVTFTDASSNTVTVNVSANGSYSANLSALTDGPISSVLNVTDDAANTASANGAAIDLDTSADLGPALALTIDAANLVTNNAEKTAVGFTVAGLDADATGVVTFTDASSNTVTVNVSANGSYSANLSALTDGPISSVLNVTDDAANTASANGAAIDLDTSADLGPALALTIDAANLVTNNAEKTAVGFTVAGLDADATGVVTFTDASSNTVTVNVSANGSYSANLSALTDGPISSVLNVTDDAANTASANGAAIDLDTSADLGPALALTIDAANLVTNNAEKTAVGFTVAGLDADATGVVTFTDASSNTVTVNVSANGSYSANLSALTDGPISSVLNVTDDAANTASANGAAIDLDTSADLGPALALTIDAANLVTNNAEKTAVGFTVAGLDADATGVVTFTDASSNTVTVNVSANGSYSANLSALTDGPISSVLNVTDDAANTASANGAAIDLDTSADLGPALALTIDAANLVTNNAEKTAVGFTVAGLDADATGVVTFTDASSNTVTVNVSANGSYSANLSALTDGPISSVLNVTDDAANTASANGAAIDLDTSADLGPALALTIDAANLVTNNAEKTAVGFTVAGLDADATGVVTFTDASSNTVTVNVSANGSYSANLSALTDGPISSVLNVTDDAANTASANGAAIDLDTSADLGPALALTIDAANLVTNNAEKTAVGFTVAGLDADATGVVTFTDASSNTVTVNVSANGSYSANLSALTDGPISSVLNVTDDAANTASANGAAIDLDTSADLGPALALTIDAANLVTNNAEKTAVGFTVAGLDADATGVVTFTDASSNTVTVNVSANGSYSANLSALTDGPISSVLNVTDDAANTASANGAAIDLDTSADLGPALALTIDAANLVTNNAEKTAVGFTVAGLDADATGVVTFTDASSNTVTVNVSANGSYSANLSALTDGPISSVLNVTDDAANTASANGAAIDLDTSADLGPALALTIDAANLVTNNAEKTAVGFTVAGLDADATGVVTFTDASSNTVTVNVSANGSYSANLSALTDGPISSVLNVTDDAANTASANGAAIDLDTSADLGPALALTIDAANLVTNNAEKTAVGFTVAGLDADATGVVTFTDASSNTVTVNVSANGSYSANLSALTDGPISSVLNVTDDAANTASANGAAIDLDTSADLGPALALTIDAANLVTNNAEKTAVGFTVAGLDADATGVVTFTDASSNTVTVNVSANGSYSANLSALTDGPISSVLNVTDDAANTASANGAAIDLDTSADLGPALALTIDAANLVTNNAEKTAVGFTVAGLDADATGVVTFTDASSNTVTVNVSANGSYSANLSALTDGPISSVLNVTDDAANTASANGAAIDLDTSADLGPALALTIDAANLVTNNAEKTAVGFTVAGLDADATGVVTFTDASSNTVTVNVSANGSYSANLSALTDGPISSVLNVTDDAANTASANGAAIDLDTSADLGPALALTIDAANLVTNNAEKTAVGFTVAGLDADATGVVTFTDASSNTVTVNVSANGSYSANLSALTDGPISSVLNVTDDAANTASANGAAIDLDTSADLGPALALTIDAANLVTNNAEKTAVGFTVAGLDADATGVVTFTDASSNTVTVNVSANGSYSANLSALTDGPISSVLNVTDDAANTASANGAAIDLDTSADLGPALALTIDAANLVTNNAEKTAVGFTVAGLDADATGVVTFTDASSNTVTVNVSANGSYSANLSALTDGPISSVLNVTDDAANTASANGAAIDLDTSADLGPALALTIDAANLVTNNAEKTAVGFTVAGLDADATGVVTFTDASSNTVTVNVSANGSYSANLSALTDGPISSVLNVTDDAANTASANGAAIDLDTSADLGPALALTIDAANLVTNNAEKTAVGFTVAGLDADATGVVTFTDASSNTVTVNVSANGSYSANLSALTDGPISSVLNVTDDAANTASANGAAIDLDTSADLGPALALTIDAANLVTNNAEKTAVGFTVAGLDADATGVVTFTDASSNTVTVNVSANGSYSANLSALTDGPISSVLNVTDDAANTASANGAAIDLDTSADLGPALALTIDAANLVTNNAEKTAVGFTVAGLDADATGVVTFTDASSNTVTVNVSANGSYSANLSALTDGPISSVLNVTDDAANTASANGAAIDLDTSADLGPALALTIDAANLVTNNAEKTAVGFTVAGLDADATGVVTFTDASSNTVTVNVSANGSYSANLSALTDGPISSVLNVTDDAANTASANGAAIDLDTSADLGPALALTIDAANLVTNNAEKTAVGFTVAGLDADATGVVTFTDASSNTVTVNVSANGSYSANLSALTDGPISSVLNVTDDAANTASANGAAIDLDTSADLGPALALTIDAANLVTNNAEKTAVGFTVAGLDADATGVVTFTDASSNTVTVNVSANGSYSANLSALTDGPISSVLNVTDDAANTASANGAAIDLDTSADLGPALALTIDAANLVTNNAEKTAVGFTVAGLDADATGVVTFTDASSNTVTVNVSANGSYSANLSALTDGPISSVLNVTDDAANTASANGAAIDLDTSADLGPALALTIDAANLVTNNAEKTAVGFTVAGLDADATGVVTFTDASSNTVTVNVSANGSYSANLSALTDGPISSVLNVTDDAANTASANGAAIDLDTSAPSVVITDDEPNTANIAGGNVVYTFQFSEAVTGFDASDVTVANATKGLFTAIDADTYTLAVTPSAGFVGNMTVDVAAAAALDAAGNDSTAAAQSVQAVDTFAPTVSIGTDDSALKIGDVAHLTFTLSEPSTTFASGDVAVTGGTLSNFAGSGTSYTADFTPTLASTTTATINVAGSTFTDAAGNNNTAATQLSMTVDTVVPTVSIGINDTALTVGDVATVTFTFSEVPSNFTAADVSYDTTSATLGAITPTGDSKVFTATLTPIASINDPTNVITVGTSWQDPAGNAPTSSSNSVNYTVNTADSTPPTVTITGTSLGGTVGSTSTVTFQFSETVTGFDPSSATDVTLTRGTLSNIIHVDGDTWTATLTRTANGSVKVDVLAGSYTDSALNPGAAGSLGPLNPAGIAGEPINLALTDPSHEGALITVTVKDVPSGWTIDGATHNADGSWTIQTNGLQALTVTTPSEFTGAAVLDVSMTWINADGTTGSMSVADNVEAYTQGSPIFAWSGDDVLTGSSGNDLFVFSQPIGFDTVHNFDAAADQIDLIGYNGLASFSDLQTHIADDANGNAVIALGDGQSITLDGVHSGALTASNFVFDQTPVVNNSGTMTIGDGALLPLSGTINNTGLISLNSTGSETLLQVIQHGVTLQGGGQILLSDSAANVISGTGPDVTLVNVDNTISGAGQLGGGMLSLDNRGTIIATGSNALVIDTGGSVVSNSGTLEATGSGGLTITGGLANSGMLLANGGDIVIHGQVTGDGDAIIGNMSQLEFHAASSADVIFGADAAGTLRLDDSFDFSGSIAGMTNDDKIDLGDIWFSTGTSAVYQANQDGSAGTLTVSDGTHDATLHILGTYDAGSFTVADDGTGRTVVGYNPADDFHFV
ncbi:Ig-like domain-containing protein [Mesorhizobium cantuariense]|uniref:Ig-like domain-containing protein n=1 Tax=Mesorhizobium cantuariense TaxID=1300275 RepID=A0ABV7MIP9_9HYPH